MPALPFSLPSGYTALNPSASVSLEVDTGGYDVLIGGFGYRIASDQQNPYVRETEQITAHRFDSSLEPGEQTLSPLPWLKSQSSFHAGAGQLNLEQGFTAFQYQQEQIEHVRYDNSYGVNPWTPGKVTRLPDTTLFTFSGITCLATAVVGGVDYAVVGGVHTLSRIAWNSGPDSAPSPASVDLTGTDFGGASNCTVQSVCTDGASYYAYVALTTAVAGAGAYVVKGSLNSTSAPTILYTIPSPAPSGIVAWVKARLVGGIGSKMYELDANAAVKSSLPVTPNYTHPSASWAWSCFCDGPQGILGAGSVNGHSSILGFELASNGGAPTLTGGEVQAPLPVGEKVLSMCNALGSFLGVGTSRGLRVATFQTYNGNVNMGPLSVTSTQPVQCVTTRDRFLYGGYTNQQADGSTGLVCVDFSMVVDAGGRFAYAPDLRPPSTAATRTGTVVAADVLPGSGRLVFATAQGIHIEGNGPGIDGPAWLRTSRIRYGTTEPKLFKLGRIRGTLDVASISVTALQPFGSATNVGTFGFLPDGNPGEFRLPTDLTEWLQLEFSLSGSACEFSGYSVKALPAPTPSELITLTLLCFNQESDRKNVKFIDPEQPRQRWENVRELAIQGGEVKFVEFTPAGPKTQMVRVEEVAFQQVNRPTSQDYFGGYLTVKMRSTEGT